MSQPAPIPHPPRSRPRGPVTPFGFEEYRRARDPRSKVNRVVRAMFAANGAYQVKPRRASRGMIFNYRPFYWSSKGYYRPGLDVRRRRPLQHFVWEHFHGRRVPAGHEIFFVNRDRHDFRKANLKLMTKGALHLKCVELGEVRQLSHDERSQIRQRWATGHSRNLTGLLFKNFNQKDKHECSFLIARRERLQSRRTVRPGRDQTVD